MHYAETVLFVDDKESQLLEGNSLLQELVRPNKDVYFAFGGLNRCFLRLFGSDEAREQTYLHSEPREPRLERPEMLLRQYSCRDENAHLIPRRYGAESCPHCDLCFAEADIPDKQAIHRENPRHVRHNLVYCLELIRRLVEGEGLDELRVHFAVGVKGFTAFKLTFRVNLHEYAGFLLSVFLHLLGVALPCFAPKSVELDGLALVFVEGGNLA